MTTAQKSWPARVCVCVCVCACVCVLMFYLFSSFCCTLFNSGFCLAARCFIYPSAGVKCGVVKVLPLSRVASPSSSCDVSRCVGGRRWNGPERLRLSCRGGGGQHAVLTTRCSSRGNSSVWAGAWNHSHEARSSGAMKQLHPSERERFKYKWNEKQRLDQVLWYFNLKGFYWSK